MTEIFSDAYAASRDAFDPLGDFRGEFHLPLHDGKPQAYFVGNSLGLQPKGARAHVEEVLDKWATQAVEGHFTGQAQWMPYHELVRDPLARVVGAQPREVVAMNSLTANLHLMLVTFYRPTRERPVLLMEAGAFPSDRYALESQLRFHGFDPAEALVEVVPDEADGTFSMAAIERAIAEHGSRLACIVWPGVQYRTGQAFDLEEIARLGHAAGAIVGFDLAHAVGNLPLQLHDSGADFAVWCHYKYMNSGPGAVAGCFVHERHARTNRPRFAGWWGNDPGVRFRMGPEFNPTPGADGWQLSNPPILGLAPLRASLDQFDRADDAGAARRSRNR
jgi:kynureninase